MNLEPSNQMNLFNLNSYLIELINLYKKNKLPNKILLSGEKGIGKCTVAYHLINYILSSNEDFSYDLKNFKINPENKSFKLIQNKSNPNFNIIDVAVDKKNIDINQIRNLIINLNKSSFNSKPRFVLIDNIDLMNTNSGNALLKFLEEPNDNINFILINNNKKILPTLKSRCLNFKITLSYDHSIDVVNKILDNKIIKLISENNIYSKNTSIKELLSLIIQDKHYKKELSINDLTYSLIELYFRNNMKIENIKLSNLYSYFIKKIDNTRKFNLDEESLFMEFEDRVLNG